MSNLTKQYLRSVLDYDPITGVFTWCSRSSTKIKIGDKAGYINNLYGYRLIRVDGIKYGAHRLAWLYVHGSFPENEIDHINGIRDDNRIVNLRAVDRQTNARNMKKRKNNTSGVTGVDWHKCKNKWRAQINGNNGIIHLGYSKSLFEVVCLRKSAEIEHGYHENHGRS